MIKFIKFWVQASRETFKIYKIFIKFIKLPSKLQQTRLYKYFINFTLKVKFIKFIKPGLLKFRRKLYTFYKFYKF